MARSRPGWRKRAARRGTSPAEAAAWGLLAAFTLRALGVPVALPPPDPAMGTWTNRPARKPRDLGTAEVVDEKEPEVTE